MKRSILLIALLLTLWVSAQQNYYTIYNFTVAPEEAQTVYQLTNDYYTKHKPAGVTVALWENHFNDSGNNFTHSIVFLGSLDAIGSMYASDGGDTWSLFLTRLNQHIKDGFSSGTGHVLSTYGDTSGDYPVQRYYILDVENGAKYIAAFNKFQSTLPAGVYVATGVISAGNSPEGETNWVIAGYKDFKTAIGGTNSLLSGAALDARNKAWDEFLATNGGVRMVRSGLRVRLGNW